MKYDRKSKGSSAEAFGSIDNGDFSLMLNIVQRHKDFVKKHLAELPEDLQYYFKRAYNALSKRDFNQDMGFGLPDSKSYWNSKVRDTIGKFGDNINKKLADVKNRRSPTKPGSPPEQGDLGNDAEQPMKVVSKTPVGDLTTKPLQKKSLFGR